MENFKLKRDVKKRVPHQIVGNVGNSGRKMWDFQMQRKKGNWDCGEN